MSIEFIYPEFEVVRNETDVLPVGYANANVPMEFTATTKNIRL